MRKNILTLMLGLSFLLVGASIAKAEAVSNVSATAASMAEKSISISKMKLSYLTKKCALVGACENALLGANIAYSLAVTTCSAQGWGSSGCESALGVALDAANNAASICSEQIQTKNIRIVPKNSVSKNKETAFG